MSCTIALSYHAASEMVPTRIAIVATTGRGAPAPSSREHTTEESAVHIVLADAVNPILMLGDVM
eukprot:3527387-Rhodomonas_salina.1